MRKILILFAILLIPYGAFADRALFNKSSDTMDDITNGSTYVKTENNLTDAEKTLLGNTSGTNTGDESSATATAEGIVELATTAEAETGTDTDRACTPAGVLASINANAVGEDLTVEDHGNQSGPTLNCSLTTYIVHKITVTGDLAITTTNWGSSGTERKAIYYIVNGGAYTTTIDGMSFPGLASSGTTKIELSTIDGGTTIVGGMTNNLGGGWS